MPCVLFRAGRAQLDRPPDQVVRCTRGCGSASESRQDSEGVAPLRDRVGSGKGSRLRMRDEPRLPSRHQLDHVVPTVIHDPEEKHAGTGAVAASYDGEPGAVLEPGRRPGDRRDRPGHRVERAVAGPIGVECGVAPNRSGQDAVGAGRDRPRVSQDAGRAVGSAPGGELVLQPGFRGPACQPRRRDTGPEEGARTLRRGRSRGAPGLAPGPRRRARQGADARGPQPARKGDHAI